MHYFVKVKIGGIAGLIAPLIGKQPADTQIWVLNGHAAAFVKLEGQLYDGGLFGGSSCQLPPHSHRDLKIQYKHSAPTLRSPDFLFGLVRFHLNSLPVYGTPDRSRQRRDKMVEGKAGALTVRRHARKNIFFETDTGDDNPAQGSLSACRQPSS